MPLKLKDVPTIITILLGFAVIPLAARGSIQLAGLAVILGGVSDMLDGAIARATKTQNKFGAELDLVSDLVIYSLASSVIVFFSLAPISVLLGYCLGVLPLLFGCLRLARFNVRKIEYPGYWVGLTRPGVAGLITAYFNSTIFVAYKPLVLTAAFVIVVSALNISLVPYIGHHKRQLSQWQLAVIALVSCGLVAAAALGHWWDGLLVVATLYLLSPLTIPHDDRVRLRKFIAAWKAEDSQEALESQGMD